MGALTTNSDLKNNYSTVKVSCGNRRISTGRLKVGCFVGDFTKTGIGSLINTGAVIGTGCMLVHSGCVSPRYMPSFSWFIGNRLTEGDPLSSVLATCETVTGRRGVSFGGAFEQLVRGLYEQTAGERSEEVMKWKDTSKPD